MLVEFWFVFPMLIMHSLHNTYRLQKPTWRICNNNFIKFTNACHNQLLLMLEIEWEFCMLCAHYLIRSLYSTQTLNINEFLKIKIPFFWNTTYRHNDAKDKTTKSCRKVSASQELRLVLAKVDLHLVMGMYQNTSRKQKARVWLRQMSTTGGSVWGAGRIVLGAMAMTQISIADEAHTMLRSGA